MFKSQELYGRILKEGKENLVLELAYQSTHEMEDYGQRLSEEMNSLAVHLQRRAKELDDSCHVNSCGVVQSRGLDIDILCALYGKSIEVAKRAQRLLTRG